MKIRMLEHYQGRDKPTLEFPKEYDSSDIGLALCQNLVDHGKAVDITPPPPQPTPEPKPTAKKPATRARKKAAPKTTRGRAKSNEES